MNAGNWNSPGAPGGMGGAATHLWAQALRRMDRGRQARGQLLEQAGYGPRTTPSTVILAEPGIRLHRYAPTDPGGPPVLLVPAPIKRAYIWDLAPAVSVVGRWREAGYRVYLAEWLPTPDGDPDVGLADYGGRMLAACGRAIAADGDPARADEPLTLAGHSLGGILAAIYSCLHAERVRATVLLESPLHVDRRACCFGPLVDAAPDAHRIAALFGHVPGAFLNLMSAMAEPGAFGWERIADRWLSLADPAALATHMRVERWAHDEFALPGRLFAEIVESLYRHDRFMQGRLEIGGRAIGPRDLRAPLLCVVDFRSKVIPPASVLPFHEAAASARKRVLGYHGDVGVNLQHVGVLVGRSAHATIWPAIFAWLDEAAPRAGGAAPASPACPAAA